MHDDDLPKGEIVMRRTAVKPHSFSLQLGFPAFHTTLGDLALGEDSQVFSQDLARRTFGNRLDERNPAAQPLVPRCPALDPPGNLALDVGLLLLGHAAETGLGHNIRTWQLGRLLRVLDTDDACVGDQMVLQEERLEFRRRDCNGQGGARRLVADSSPWYPLYLINSLARSTILRRSATSLRYAAPSSLEEPVFVALGHISRPKPAALSKGRLGSFDIAPVPLHDARPT